MQNSSGHTLAFYACLTISLCGPLALAGCSSAGVRMVEAAPSADTRNTLRFDNQGRDRLDIYLIGETRSWKLGRLEPGQARWFALPGDIPPSDFSRLQLSVIANATATVDPRSDPRAITSLKQPVGTLISRRWGYTLGQLTDAPAGAPMPR